MKTLIKAMTLIIALRSVIVLGLEAKYGPTAIQEPVFCCSSQFLDESFRILVSVYPLSSIFLDEVVQALEELFMLIGLSARAQLTFCLCS